MAGRVQDGETRSIPGAAARLNLTRYRFRYSPHNWPGWLTGAPDKKMEATRATRFLLLATSWSLLSAVSKKSAGREREEEEVIRHTVVWRGRRDERARQEEGEEENGDGREDEQAREKRRQAGTRLEGGDEEEANECRLTVRDA